MESVKISKSTLQELFIQLKRDMESSKTKISQYHQRLVEALTTLRTEFFQLQNFYENSQLNLYSAQQNNIQLTNQLNIIQEAYNALSEQNKMLQFQIQTLQYELQTLQKNLESRPQPMELEEEPPKVQPKYSLENKIPIPFDDDKLKLRFSKKKGALIKFYEGLDYTITDQIAVYF